MRAARALRPRVRSDRGRGGDGVNRGESTPGRSPVSNGAPAFGRAGARAWRSISSSAGAAPQASRRDAPTAGRCARTRTGHGTGRRRSRRRRGRRRDAQRAASVRKVRRSQASGLKAPKRESEAPMSYSASSPLSCSVSRNCSTSARPSPLSFIRRGSET